jgi:hypothetical protein
MTKLSSLLQIASYLSLVLFFLPILCFLSQILLMFKQLVSIDGVVSQPLLLPMVEPSNSSLKSMIDELQQMVAGLGEQIKDRCGGLEGRIEESEQCAEEHLVALEV